MRITKRLWAVLDYGLAGLSQDESENANKDIVQAIKDVDTLKGQRDALLAACEEECKNCRQFGRACGFEPKEECVACLTGAAIAKATKGE